MKKSDIYLTKTYLAIAKEPIFVGTGGYRIGRVDNTIVREAGTGIPKIPGTTIEGNARYFSWLTYKQNMNLKLGCAKGKTIKDAEEQEKEPCGECRVCLTYGYVKKEKEGAKARGGLAYFSDARILFFPVATMVGPVWITCKRVLEEVVDTGGDQSIIKNLSDDAFVSAEKLKNSLPQTGDGQKVLNFGWIMLRKSDGNEITPENWKLKGEFIVNLKTIVDRIKNKICVVPDELFTQIVNSNLETRTSVSINPVTGAAESGALFTYEAIPRGTIFWFEVTYENPKNYQLNKPIKVVIETVEDGFDLFSAIGIGGMGTRGFGKIEIISKLQEEKEYWERIKDFIQNLKEEQKNLEEKFQSEEKEKIEKRLKEIKEKINLWCNYVKNWQEKLKEEAEKAKNSLVILEEIIKICEE